MKPKTPHHAYIFSPAQRIVLGSVVILFLLVLLAGAASIPFVFESQSIRYKFGFDRILLRTGKILGTIAATLFLLQLILSARLKILDRIFGLNKLYIVHRFNAVMIAVLAIMHPLFVFAPEDITNLPLELKFWPEILGAVLLLSICTITATGLWRCFLDLPFHLWWLAHRVATFIAATILFVHVLFVSDTFEQGQPRLTVLFIAAAYLLFYCWLKLRLFLRKRRFYTITAVPKAAQNTYSINLTPQEGNPFSYLPGQFAFISFQSQDVVPEEHPFTISSSPSRPDNLQFSIHCSGDWTRRIGHLKTGDTAVIDGPFGLFSHLVRAHSEEIIMIAGGIGITPMLSMLRYMADEQDTRRVILIWSNRTRADKVYEEEFKELEKRLSGLRVIDVFTREQVQQDAAHRLDRNMLEKLLADCDRQATVFICGPPLMMRDMQRILIQIGFKRRLIFTEEFAL